jgi:hypothetical protein
MSARDVPNLMTPSAAPSLLNAHDNKGLSERRPKWSALTAPRRIVAAAASRVGRELKISNKIMRWQKEGPPAIIVSVTSRLIWAGNSAY